MPDINPAHVRRAFDRAADSYDAAAVLQREICQRLLERLDCVRLQPGLILDAGCGTGQAIPGLFERYRKARLIALDISEKMLQKAARRGGIWRKPSLLCASIEALPLADDSVDLVFSSLSLQWCRDSGRAFAEVLRVLRPGGLFVFSTFGPDTLKELRASWRQVDENVHVNPFADMHDIGDALLAGGYAEPVMEAEHLTVNYARPGDLLQDLRAIGATVTASGHRTGLTTERALKKMLAAYRQYRTEAGYPATYEIVYGHAWKAQAQPPSRGIEVTPPGYQQGHPA